MGLFVAPECPEVIGQEVAYTGNHNRYHVSHQVMQAVCQPEGESVLQSDAKPGGDSVLAKLLCPDFKARMGLSSGSRLQSGGLNPVSPGPESVPGKVVQRGDGNRQTQRGVQTAARVFNELKKKLLIDKQHHHIDHGTTGADDAKFDVAKALEPFNPSQESVL